MKYLVMIIRNCEGCGGIHAEIAALMNEPLIYDSSSDAVQMMIQMNLLRPDGPESTYSVVEAEQCPSPVPQEGALLWAVYEEGLSVSTISGDTHEEALSKAKSLAGYHGVDARLLWVEPAYGPDFEHVINSERISWPRPNRRTAN